MRKLLTIIVLTAVLALTGGCWSKYELTEKGFVMGVALDYGKEGKIKMLTQIYRPASVEAGKSMSSIEASINIKTIDDTVFEAIRDIPIHLGRKAQWSHMRVIIIGEELAKKTEINKIIDFFYRDHEPRSNVSLMISKGEAAKLFEKKPLIEQTTSQQFLRTEEFSYESSGKTLNTTMLDLIRQLRSAHPDIVISYVYEDQKAQKMFSAAGLAMLKDGVMKGVMPAGKVEGLVILRNEYKSGVVEVPCPGMKGQKETAEVLSLNVKTKPVIKDDKINVTVKMKGDLAIAELKCTKIETAEDEKEFLAKVSAEIKKQSQGAIDFMQKKKMDAIGIGNQIYRSSPKTWGKLKSNWDERFAAITFDFQMEMNLVTSGATSGKPAS